MYHRYFEHTVLCCPKIEVLRGNGRGVDFGGDDKLASYYQG